MYIYIYTYESIILGKERVYYSIKQNSMSYILFYSLYR